MVNRSNKARLFILTLFVLLQVGGIALGQSKKPASLAELAAYTGADREQRLLTGAKAEGKVVWYTSLAGSSYKELAKGFETKYPGVKIEPYRGTSNDLMTKIVAEAEAKHFLADAIETTLPVLRYMRENKILVPYTSPHLGKYPAHAKEKADRGLFYWAIDRETYMGVGYNTNVIPGVCGSQELCRSLEARAQRENGICHQRYGNPDDWRYGQTQGRRVRQEIESSGHYATLDFRAGDG